MFKLRSQIQPLFKYKVSANSYISLWNDPWLKTGFIIGSEISDIEINVI